MGKPEESCSSCCVDFSDTPSLETFGWGVPLPGVDQGEDIRGGFGSYEKTDAIFSAFYASFRSLVTLMLCCSTEIKTKPNYFVKRKYSYVTDEFGTLELPTDDDTWLTIQQ